MMLFAISFPALKAVNICKYSKFLSFIFFSIKGSCGPQSQTCLQYNFALVPGQYTEYVGRTIPITKANIQERSENILEQWGKTGSLYPHNVVCIYL